MQRTFIIGLVAVAALAVWANGAAAAEPATVVAAPLSAREQDRRAILAMAGNFKVRFDFRETAAFVPDYQPIPAKVSGGHEVVRVIEDGNDCIVLQHILVAEVDGKPLIIKHWRQDWTYQPKSVLGYDGHGQWTERKLASTVAAGAWSQTVWQTDDSPRYGGVGHWTHTNGVSAWQGATLRPLARRDATRKPPYDRYQSVNRQALTPTGWVHEQDNQKVGLRGGKLVTFVDEDVINTYTRDDAFNVAAADDYWAKTAVYWAEVRKAWTGKFSHGPAVVEEEAENGSVTGSKLMGLADEIAAGKIAEAAAIVTARNIIADIGPGLAARQP